MNIVTGTAWFALMALCVWLALVVIHRKEPLEPPAKWKLVTAIVGGVLVGTALFYVLVKTDDPIPKLPLY